MWVSPKGVFQTPITPMTSDFQLDSATFEKLVDWHIRTGAVGLVWPYHKGESLNLTIEERKRFAETAIRVAAGRVPVVIHVSALAPADTLDLARHAQKIGATAIISITPYFWKPTAEAIIHHFVRLGTSIEIPFLAYNSPGYLDGVELNADITRTLIERLPNFVGCKEASFDSEKFIEITRVALSMRPTFAMMTGVEYLLPSVPLGGSGSYSSAGAICPGMVNALYAACANRDYERARALQYSVSRIWLMFRDQYPSSLKGGMAIMGRAVGPTRGPLPTASPERLAYLRSQLEDIAVFESEPTGW